MSGTQFDLAQTTRQRRYEKQLHPPVKFPEHITQSLQTYLENKKSLEFVGQLHQFLSDASHPTSQQQYIQLKKIAQTIQKVSKEIISKPENYSSVQDDFEALMKSLISMMIYLDKNELTILETVDNSSETPAFTRTTQPNSHILIVGVGLALKAVPELYSKPLLEAFLQSFVTNLTKNMYLQSMYTIEELTDNPLAKTFLGNHIITIMDYFAKQLHSHYETLLSQHGTSNIQDHVIHVEELLKRLSSIHDRLYKYFETAIEPLVRSRLQKEASPSEELQHQHQLFSSLLLTLSNFIRRNWWKRELVFTAGLCFSKALGSILEVAASVYHPSASEEATKYIAQQLHNSFLATTMSSTQSSSSTTNNVIAEIFSSNVAIAILDEIPELPILLVTRGLLLSLEAPVLIASIQTNSSSSSSSILLDIMYPVICKNCESTPDRYTRTLSLQTLSDCLTRIRESMKLTQPSTRMFLEKLFSGNFFDEVLDFAFQNAEHKFGAMIEQSRNVFKGLIDIYEEMFVQFRESTNPKIQQIRENFMKDLITRLVVMDWHKKSKFNLLSLVFDRTGAKKILQSHPKFLMNLFACMSNSVVCSPASMLLEIFLLALIKEHSDQPQSNDQSKNQSAKAAPVSETTLQAVYPIVFSALTEAMYASMSSFNRGVVIYGFPTVFKIFPKCLLDLLKFITNHSEKEYQRILSENSETTRAENQMELTSNTTKILLSAIKMARQNRIISGDMLEHVMDDCGISTTAVLTSALNGQNEDMCIDALELVCVTAKEIEEISDFEYSIMRIFFTSDLKSPRTGFRQEVIGRLRKFFQRLREQTRREQEKYKTAVKMIVKNATPSTEPQVKKTAQPVRSHSKPKVPTTATQSAIEFLNFICDESAKCLYPGAPFARMSIPLQIFKCVTELWANDITVEITEDLSKQTSETLQKISEVPKPLPITVFSAKNSLILFHLLWDRFDTARNTVFDILNQFPAPLPGLENPSKFQMLLDCGLRLVESPRQRETDSGALLLVLLLNKYILPLNWSFEIQLSEDKSSDYKWTLVVKSQAQSREQAIFSSLKSLASLLQQHKRIAQENLALAVLKKPMHGLITALRYLFGAISIRSLNVTSSSPSANDWNTLVKDLIETVADILEIALTAVSDIAPEGYRVEKDANSAYSGPMGQLVAVTSWLAVKESGLFLATIAKNIPWPNNEEVKAAENEIGLSFEQIILIGETLMSLLQKSRHIGAIEKTYVAFQTLCDMLLTSRYKKLWELPSTWVKSFMWSVEHAPEISRRSAGLPYLFCAILRSECVHQRYAKIHTPKVMSYLINLAKGNYEKPEHDPYQIQIHSINILRSIFMDRDIANDIEPYIPEIVRILLDGYRSPSWGVRNSASLIFSTTVDRSVGAKKTRDDHNQHERGGMNFREFFSRYPNLHNYILSHLKPIEDKSVNVDSNVVSTSIFAVMLLLSKLSPAALDSVTDSGESDSTDPDAEAPLTETVSSDTDLSPKQFVKLIQKAAVSHDFMVRKMASMALVPLISSQDLPKAVEELISKLPNAGEKFCSNEVHGILLQIKELLAGHINNKILSASQLDEITNSVLPQLSSKLWLLRDKCHPISSVLLQIAQDFFPRNSALVEQVAAIALKLLTEDEPVSFGANATYKSVKNVDAAKVVLETFGKTEKQEAILRTLLHHYDYEVRSHTLKFLKRNLYVSQNLLANHFRRLDFGKYGSEMLDMLFSEQNPSCMKKILQLIQYRGVPIFPPESGGHNLQTFTKIYEILRHLLSTSAKNHVIAFMGYLFNQWFLSRGTPELSDIEHTFLQDWLKILQEYSDPSQMLDYRKSVTNSVCFALRASSHGNKFEDQISAVQEILVEAWLTLIVLLQDEEDSVRNQSALFVSQELQFSQNSNNTKHFLQQYESFKPSFAQNVILEHLTAHCWNSKSYFKFLTVKITDTDYDEIFNIDESSWRLFEKEDDNIFQEDFIFGQFRSSHLRKLLTNYIQKSTQPPVSIEALREKALSNLLEFSQKIRKIQPTDSIWLWSPYLTHKGEFFVLLFHLLSSVNVLLAVVPQQTAREGLRPVLEGLSKDCHFLLQKEIDQLL